MRFSNGNPGGLYNYNDFMKRIMDELEIEDVPLPVTNVQIQEHFVDAVLKPFSIVYPRRDVVTIDEHDRIRMTPGYNNSMCYRIPMYKYPAGTVCLGVSRIDPIDPYCNDPYYMGANCSMESILANLSEIRMISDIGSAVTRSVTLKFVKPDQLYVYGGYFGCYYEIELLLAHDPSLATIPDTAYESLVEFTVLDMKAYLYGKLKRKDGIDTVVGNIDLKIADWADAAQQKKELYKEWKSQATFSIDYPVFF